MTTTRYHRRVIRIRAEDSPNVRLAMAQIARGEEPTGEVLVPGVLSYDEYKTRRKLWDPVRQCIGLDGEFYEGAEVLLYPPEWLNAAEQYADSIRGQRRLAKTIGIDPAEGGDRTVWAVCDEKGLMELVSKQTPDTSIIANETLMLMRKHGVEAEGVLFDRGGGGKQIADRMRAAGQHVRTVGFGESVTPEKRAGRVPIASRREEAEDRYTYYNRRAEMYWRLRLKLDPVEGAQFGIPAEFSELRRQLSLMPVRWDDEGRFFMLPKNRRGAGKTETLIELLGHSPDEADALVLAVYGLTKKTTRRTAGAIILR